MEERESERQSEGESWKKREREREREIESMACNKEMIAQENLASRLQSNTVSEIISSL